MRAGALRHFLVIEAPTDISEVPGEVTLAWREVGRVWASVDQVGGLEAMRAGAPEAVGMFRIRLRPLADVRFKATWRAKLGDRVFEFQGPPRDYGQKGRELEVMAQEVEP